MYSCIDTIWCKIVIYFPTLSFSCGIDKKSGYILAHIRDFRAILVRQLKSLIR